VSPPRPTGRWPGVLRSAAGAVGVVLVVAGGALVVQQLDRPRFEPAGALPPATTSAPGPPSAVRPAPLGPAAAGPAAVSASAPRVLVDASFTPTRIGLAGLSVDAPVVPVDVEPGGALRIPVDPRVVGWWSGGAAPGSPVGTVLVTGHVDSATLGRGSLYALGQIPVGSRITLRTAGRTQTYVVDARRRYGKAALPWRTLFAQGENPRLVLVTCGGAFDEATRHYSDNVVVVATPVSG
jgi:hypothetical protein